MISNRILFVDDDANVLAAFKRSLHKRFSIVTALSGEEGLNRLASEGPFSVVVADMQMPGMNGVQFLKSAQEQHPDTVRLMLTGNADQKTAADAVNQGHVFSFLTKPCPPESLEMALANAIRQHSLVMAEKELLEQTLNGAIKVLTDILSITDPVSFGRAQRLREEMKAVAAWFRAPRPWELEIAAMLSQIGYVTLPQTLVTRARAGDPLTPNEKDMLTRVPLAGASLLERIPRLEAVAEIVLYQHKNFDGSGYPCNDVQGDKIPIGARILRVLNDLLLAETAKRSRTEAFASMREKVGRYDPKVLKAVAACFDIYVEAKSAEATIASIRVSELALNDVLLEEVKTSNGMLLVSRDTRITRPLLEKLRNFHELYGLNEPLLVKRSPESRA